MPDTKNPLPSSNETPVMVWVLAPQIQSTDSNLEFYYDYTQSQEELSRAFAELHQAWQWEWVTCSNYREVIDACVLRSGPRNPVFFNLCDGDDIHEVPGLSVVNYLEENNLCFTGANAFFYEATTSKITLKKLFEKHGVSTPPWEIIAEDGSTVNGIFTRLQAPLIIKPAVSAGSMGVTTHSVVSNEKELLEQLQRLRSGYHGWELSSGGIIAEKFIAGNEYTTFITGHYLHPREATLYTPVERLFNARLPENEKFLSFERLWGMYADEVPLDEKENLWEYELPDASLMEDIKHTSWNAYVACGGTGYGRVDLRRDSRTGKLYVLEVNAQCGLSEDENYTSIGAILRYSALPFSHIIREIIREAIHNTRLPLKRAVHAASIKIKSPVL